MKKIKLYTLGLLLTSLWVYLEWGTDQQQFLVEMEIEVLGKLFANPLPHLHPFILLPLAGQISLLITLFQK